MRSKASSEEISIFELVARTKKFVRYELVHAGFAVCIFLIIFLVLEPWDDTYYYMGAHPFWFVGPPLVYFTLDLFFAVTLHLALQNELRPKSCLIWIMFQILNLILLTILGFYMVWNFYHRDNTHLRLIVALMVLYCYKSYRISKMHKLINEMRSRCRISVNVSQTQERYGTTKSPYTISTGNNNTRMSGAIPFDV